MLNLEVDHIDADAKTENMQWHWDEERRAEELSKCQVLCEQCHLDKSALYMAEFARHGTEAMYRHYHCKCDECLEANRVASRLKKDRYRKNQYTPKPDQKMERRVPVNPFTLARQRAVDRRYEIRVGDWSGGFPYLGGFGFI